MIEVQVPGDTDFVAAEDDTPLVGEVAVPVVDCPGNAPMVA
jgi:hypothetical protein